MHELKRKENMGCDCDRTPLLFHYMLFCFELQLLEMAVQTRLLLTTTTTMVVVFSWYSTFVGSKLVAAHDTHTTQNKILCEFVIPTTRSKTGVYNKFAVCSYHVSQQFLSTKTDPEHKKHCPTPRFLLDAVLPGPYCICCKGAGT